MYYHLKNSFAAVYDPGVDDPVLLGEIKAALKEANIAIADEARVPVRYAERR